jgi:hypothetical protein
MSVADTGSDDDYSRIGDREFFIHSSVRRSPVCCVRPYGGRTFVAFKVVGAYRLTVSLGIGRALEQRQRADQSTTRKMTANN